MLVLSEVPASKTLFEKRAGELQRRLNECGGHWSMARSEPTGASPTDKALEYHIVLVKEPVRLEAASVTHEHIHGTFMGHAPFTCLIRVPFFRTVQTFAITGVHLALDSPRSAPAAS